MKKSRYTLNQNGYEEEFIYGGRILNIKKKPLFISKQKTAVYSSKSYQKLTGYEVGNHIEKMSIARIDDIHYRLELELRYGDTKIYYNKAFIAVLQTA